MSLSKYFSSVLDLLCPCPNSNLTKLASTGSLSHFLYILTCPSFLLLFLSLSFSLLPTLYLLYLFLPFPLPLSPALLYSSISVLEQLFRWMVPQYTTLTTRPVSDYPSALLGCFPAHWHTESNTQTRKKTHTHKDHAHTQTQTLSPSYTLSFSHSLSHTHTRLPRT